MSLLYGQEFTLEVVSPEIAHYLHEGVFGRFLTLAVLGVQKFRAHPRAYDIVRLMQNVHRRIADRKRFVAQI
jgi:hypothetical protein